GEVRIFVPGAVVFVAKAAARHSDLGNQTRGDAHVPAEPRPDRQLRARAPRSPACVARRGKSFNGALISITRNADAVSGGRICGIDAFSVFCRSPTGAREGGPTGPSGVSISVAQSRNGPIKV